jgi:spore maturation protein SpmA
VNWIFVILVVGAVVTAAFTGSMQAVTDASISSAKGAVDLSLMLVGQMTLWLGFVGVLREAGLMASFAKAVRPVMTRLFPEVPADHPAMSSMILNMSANLLGLGNAATPFGLKAMQELDTLNREKGVATNAMALFLTINAAGLSVLPLSTLAVRAALGSHDPAGIIVPTIITTACSTTLAVIACKLLERFTVRAAVTGPITAASAVDQAALERASAIAAIAPSAPAWKVGLSALVGLALVAALGRAVVTNSATPPFELVRSLLSSWLVPLLLATIALTAFGRGVKVYEAFIGAAKEGFSTAIAVIPFLVGMLVAIGMFRASGAMEVVVHALSVVTSPFGFPVEALPMALIRPMSGSGAMGVMSEVMKTHGPDSFVGYLVSVINGGTETTFYVLALYFGAAQVRAIRHTLAACLVSDLAAPVIAFAVCRAFF